VIADAAALNAGSVGPIGLLRIREVLEQEQVQRRVHGWTVESGISKQIASSWTSDLDDGDVFGAATFAMPLALRHQVVAEARISATANNTFGDYYTFMASLKYVYEISNRVDIILAENYLKTRILYRNRAGQELGGHQNGLAITTFYYLENNVSIQIGAQLDHQLNWRNWQRFVESSRRWWSFDLSVGYHVF
jgi:hypothetical protein